MLLKFEWSHSQWGLQIQDVYIIFDNFRPVSRYISEIVQSINIVTIELSEELRCALLNDAVASDLEWPLTNPYAAFPVNVMGGATDFKFGI